MAKSRLHFVLVQDRSGLTNEQMAEFKKSLLDVMERYFVIDKQAFDIAYKRGEDTTTLVINSPVIIRRQEAMNGQVGARRALMRKAEARDADMEATQEDETEEVQPSANG
jgi:cell division topological specificity factor